jgi:hypothetical protein
MRYFSGVPENLLQRLDLDLPDLASTPVWETFLDHPTVMADAFLNSSGGQASTAVLAEYIHAVARAFQRTQAAIDMEAELSVSLETPFSFVEFLHALMGGGNSAPGESGTTYRLLQVLPLVIQEEIFEHLAMFWAAA